jgi:ParB-like chromosome segregation protein Spo0J
MKELKKLTLEEISKLEFHPLANLFPLREGSELDELTGDIERNGLSQPIVLLQSKILDGRNRYNACRKLGLGTRDKPTWYPFVAFENSPRSDGVTLTEAATAFVITKNIMRRNLTSDQRAMIAAELYSKLPKREHGGDRKSNSAITELEKSPTADTQKIAVAKQVDVSVTKVERAAALQKKDVSKAQQVKAGTKTMAQAEHELKQPEPACAQQQTQKKVPVDKVGIVKVRDQEFGEVAKPRAQIRKLKSDILKLKAASSRFCTLIAAITSQAPSWKRRIDSSPR